MKNRVLQQERRQGERKRSCLSLDYTLYAEKICNGTTSLKNISHGGMLMMLTRPPLPEAIISFRGNRKKISRHIDIGRVITDTDGDPIGRVVWVKKNARNGKCYDVGVRFLEKPFVR